MNRATTSLEIETVIRNLTTGLRRREKAHRARGEGAKPLAAGAAHRGGKRRAAPGRECTQAPGCPGRLPLREKARRTWGERAQTSGCPSCSPRREKARRTRGEAAKTSACLARTQRVLRTHSDICLQGPALRAAGLN